MANYYGNARTNYFRVKDEAAFRAWVDTAGLELWAGSSGNEGAFALGPGEFSDNGTLELPFDEETDEMRSLIDELAPLLADGSICIVMEAGAEKLRYIVGHAVAFNNAGESVHVSLDDIYELAKKKFGIEPTECTY